MVSAVAVNSVNSTNFSCVVFLQNENNSCSSEKVTNFKKPLGCFLFRVGDDDSGPEDIVDDEDLECETAKMITFRYILE